MIRETGQIFINFRNLASQEQYSWVSIHPCLWPNGGTDIFSYLYKAYYKARFPEYTFDVNTIATNLYMEHNFSLPKEFTFEISGWFNSASIWGGSWLSKPQGSSWIWGAQKVLLMGGRANVKIGVTDILYTAMAFIQRCHSRFKIRAMGLGKASESMSILTIVFGSSDVKSARRRTTGLEGKQKD